MRTILTLAIVAFSIVSVQAQDAAFLVKADKAAPPKDVPAAIAAVLGEQALVVETDKGQAVGTIWLRKTLPSKAAPEQVKTGLTYRELQQSTLIGIVHFPQVWSDYRNQKIAAGVYTLRFGLQPENGDHQGTAPYNDFCLLLPIAKDTKPDNMDVKDLHELSSFAPGGTHPGVLLLFPNTKPAAEPKIENKPNGIQVLFTRMTVEAAGQMAPLGFGFVVAGHAKE